VCFACSFDSDEDDGADTNAQALAALRANKRLGSESMGSLNVSMSGKSARSTGSSRSMGPKPKKVGVAL